MARGLQARTVSDGGLTQAYPRASGNSDLAPDRILFATDRHKPVVHPLDLRQIVCGRSVAEVLQQRLVLRQQLEELSPLLLLAGRNGQRLGPSVPLLVERRHLSDDLLELCE